MKPNIWMPLYIGDYLRDTSRLTTEQHGAYLLLLMDYWVNGALPDDDEQLGAITKLGTEHFKTQKLVLMQFFRREQRDANAAAPANDHANASAPAWWVQKRVEEELSKARAVSGVRSTAAKAKWAKKRASDANASAPAPANGMHVDMHLEVPSPSPSPCTHTPPCTFQRGDGEEVSMAQAPEPVIPTPEEVETHGDRVGVPAEYCAYYHATCDEKHRWVTGNGHLLDWRREMKRWWQTDRNAEPGITVLGPSSD